MRFWSPPAESAPQPGGSGCVVVVVTSQPKCSEKESSRRGSTSFTATARPSSSLSDVTPLPTMPQGTMCLNHDRSVLTLRAKP